MDTSEAAKMPGVRAILRYDDPEIPAMALLGGHEPFDITVLPDVAHF
jgi:hypothetical protein